MLELQRCLFRRLKEDVDGGSTVAVQESTSTLGPIQTSFLHSYPISIINIVNLVTEPYAKDKDSQQS
ncbi:ATP-dependent Lon protease pim1 [Stygiomarasmius scandens]|uniref:ATP-dependent Lon protease pim1 n=1 Tax=Marasmiellus scandens TaxID=2682957 RepID=A0ABR1JJN2_9AGAR